MIRIISIRTSKCCKLRSGLLLLVLIYLTYKFLSINLQNNHLQLSKSAINLSESYIVEIKPFEEFVPAEHQMFFVETGERTFFKGRECCSIESAAIKSQLSQILIVMTSKVLELHLSNCTRNIYEKYPNVKFYTTTFGKVFNGTAIEGQERRYDPTFKFAKTKISDLLRMALVYKYGGFYSDLDIVTLKPLTGLKNFVPMETTFQK